MPVLGKQAPTETQVACQVERFLAERIPAGWSLQARRTERLAGRYRVDLLAEIASPADDICYSKHRALLAKLLTKRRPRRPALRVLMWGSPYHQA